MGKNRSLIFPVSIGYSHLIFPVEYDMGLLEFYGSKQDTVNVMRISDRLRPYKLATFAVPQRGTEGFQLIPGNIARLLATGYSEDILHVLSTIEDVVNSFGSPFGSVPFDISDYTPQPGDLLSGVRAIAAQEFVWTGEKDYFDPDPKRIRLYYVDREEFDKHSIVPFHSKYISAVASDD